MPDGLGGGARRLLITTDAVGGVWRYAIDLANGLTARGVSCVLAVLGPAAGPDQRAEAEAVPGLHLVQTGLPLDWTADSPAALTACSAKLATLAALTGVQGVHLHAPALMGAARWPAPVVVVGHSDLGTWWRAMREGPPPEDFAWRIAATGAGLRAAAAVIAPSAAQAAAMRAVYGPMAVQVVHNGRDPTAAASDPRERAVLTAGRLWDEAKGAMRLDAAAARLDAPVRAAGPVASPNGAAVAPTHMRLLGALGPAAMAREYAASTVFASMARYEPFGLAVLEAAQSGMRLVLSDIPTFRELWDGVAAFVGHADDLPDALRQALDGPAIGDAQAQAGRYTLDAMVHGTLAVHRGVAATPVARAG